MAQLPHEFGRNILIAIRDLAGFVASRKHPPEVNLPTEVSKASTVVAAKDQVSCDLAGESVILDLKSGIYYGLNPVGARVWTLIQEPKAVSAILESLLEQYDVAGERCEADLFALLNDLASRNLIQVDLENGKPTE